jgi:hypothetical protein
MHARSAPIRAMTDVHLTTVITWSQRPELARTLVHNRPFFDAMRSDIVVVNCGGDRETLRRLLTEADVARTTQVDLACERFNRSLALNIGIRCAAPGVVLLIDADILLTCSLRHLAETCMREQCFATFSGVSDLPPDARPMAPPPDSFLRSVIGEQYLTFEWADGRRTRVQRGRDDHGQGTRLGPGLLIARRQHLIDIGGFRSDFEGWGWEDLDVQVRLQRRLGLEPRYAQDEILHLKHGDDMRDLRGRTRASYDRANMLRACHSYAKGQFSGTYLTDVARWHHALQETVVHGGEAVSHPD